MSSKAKYLLVAAAALLAGCASTSEAPVVERSTGAPPARVEQRAPVRREPAERAPADYAPARRSLAEPAVIEPDVIEHVVSRDETLYGIAFKYGLDYRELAAWNDIGEPYRVLPGQRLRVAPTQRARRAPPPVSDRSVRRTREPYAAPSQREPYAEPSPRRIEPAAAAPARDSVSDSEAVTITQLPPDPAAARAVPATAPMPAPAPVAPAPAATRSPSAAIVLPAAPVQPAPAASAPVVVASLPGRTIAGVRWHWPAQGRVIARYSADDPARQGIDIAGAQGQAVYASANGEVVYSGNGLLGYGELVIIRHDAEFLSAYGHNRRRLVVEGDKVRAGQQIAEMGRSGAAIDLLHFEIRRGGRPVDPAAYLPPR